MIFGLSSKIFCKLLLGFPVEVMSSDLSGGGLAGLTLHLVRFENVQTIIALLFCLALIVMVNAQGWSGLLWVSVGFVIGLLVTARIAFPILLGLPRAIHLVASGEMRAAVYRRLLFAPVLWIVLLSVTLFLVRFFW